MCGIGGVISRKPLEMHERMMLVRLMRSLERRGTDAYGFYNGKQLIKNPGAFHDSDEYFQLENILENDKASLFLGHTRHVTTGDPEVNYNNHPFEMDGFVFAQNGVVYQADDQQDIHDETGIDTDSIRMLWWIIESYERTGDVVTAIQDGYKHTTGWNANWLYHKATDALYLFNMNHELLSIRHLQLLPHNGSEKFGFFASDMKAVGDALNIGPAHVMALAKPIVPNGIYRLKRNGSIKKVGTIRPKAPMAWMTADFEARFGHLTRYHRRRLRNVRPR